MGGGEGQAENYQGRILCLIEFDGDGNLTTEFTGCLRVRRRYLARRYSRVLA